MKFELKINMDNAAFCTDEDQGEAALYTLLQRLARHDMKKAYQYPDKWVNVYDENGNPCGKFKLTTDEEGL